MRLPPELALSSVRATPEASRQLEATRGNQRQLDSHRLHMGAPAPELLRPERPHLPPEASRAKRGSLKGGSLIGA